MALKKSEKRLLGLLGVVAVVFLVDRFILSSGGDEPQATDTKPKVAAVNQLLKSKATKAVPAKKASLSVVYTTWGRNPFSAPRSASTSSTAGSQSTQQAEKPELKGIFWKKGKAYVLIDDAVLGEGEENKGVRVEKIEETEVLCRRGGRSFTLYLRESP